MRCAPMTSSGNPLILATWRMQGMQGRPIIYAKSTTSQQTRGHVSTSTYVQSHTQKLKSTHLASFPTNSLTLQKQGAGSPIMWPIGPRSRHSGGQVSTPLLLGARTGSGAAGAWAMIAAPGAGAATGGHGPHGGMPPGRFKGGVAGHMVGEGGKDHAAPPALVPAFIAKVLMPSIHLHCRLLPPPKAPIHSNAFRSPPLPAASFAMLMSSIQANMPAMVSASASASALLMQVSSQLAFR